MNLFKAKDKYKRPSGRAISRRYNGGSGVFKRRQFFWQRRSFKIYITLAVVGFLFVCYLLFWSGIFRIQNIKIEGTQNLDPSRIEEIIRAQMQKRRFGLFSQSNLWFFSSKTAENRVLEAFVVNDVKVKKRPLKTLKIVIDEKPKQLTLVSNNRYYYIDPNGIAIQEVMVANLVLVQGDAPMDEPEKAATSTGEGLIDQGALDQSLPLIFDNANNEITVGQKILEPSRVDFITRLKSKGNIEGFTIKHFVLPELEGTEVRVVTEQGYQVYFDSADELDRQLANLNLVIKEKLNNNKKINYIDLRFGEKVYIN